MIADAEIWQVMCGNDIYQADFDTLKQWVAEGLVQQTDQVRKGNLRWLEAGRVPALRRVFTGEEVVAAAPPAPAAPPADQHASDAHAAGFQQAAPDPHFHHAAPADPAHAAHAAQPPQHHAPDPFAPPAQNYAPDPSQHAFGAPRYNADPSPYAPDTSHYAVDTSGFAPEVSAYAPAPAHFAAGDAAAPSPYGSHAGDPLYVQADPFAAPAWGAQEEEQQHHHAAPPPSFIPDRKDFAERAGAAPSLRALGRACYSHPQLPPKFICRACQTPMCGTCVKFVDGSRVALCPLCGDLCKDYVEVRQQAHRQVRKASGFGLGDFGEAVGYPFRNLVGLIGISIFYSLLSLGGIKGQIIAFIVIFGCMSLVIKQLAWGRTDRGFLPDFSSMSLWDDVAVPCFLGIGITIVTIGPAIVLFLALLFGLLNGGPSSAGQQPSLIEQEQEQIAKDAATIMDPEASGEDVERAHANMTKRRAGEMQGALGEVPAESITQQMGALMGAGIVLVLLLLVSLLWAFFYYPMALIVAGYTEDFWAVVNPLVGLDTIRRMGWNYVWAFLMYAGVQLFALVAGLVVSYALSAFDMPLVGNIPARFIGGGINFYTSLVIAALLGLALYKSSDRLGIATD